MELKNQPSAWPTRKIMAVIVSGMVMGGLQAGLDLFWPDHPLDVMMEQLDIWLQGGIMILAGYIVREREE